MKLITAETMMRLYACLCVLLLTKHLYAGDQQRVRYLGIEQGLSNNAVTCIYKDHQGFMWFGTYDGLNRYNGYDFRVFRNIIGDPSSLSDNHIYNIEGDWNYNLWIGGVKGISIFDPARSKFYQPKFRNASTNTVQDVKESTPGIKNINNQFMLVGTDANGLLVFKGANAIGVQVPLSRATGRYEYAATSIEFDPIKKITWVFVDQYGLCQYDVGSNTLRLVSDQVKHASCLEAGKDGKIWLGVENGLYRYDDNLKHFSENLMPFKNRVVHLFNDKNSTLWIASDGGGIWNMPASSNQPQPFLSDDKKPLVNSNAVYDIYEDSDGRKWVGTLRGGINIIESPVNAFRHITYNLPGQSSTINNFILSFCEDEKNNVWIGTDGAGLTYWDRTKNSFTNYVHDPLVPKSISSNFITNITKDAYNDIWVTTWFGGINRFNRSSRSFKQYTCYNTQTSSAENNVWLIYEDRNKVLWASATNNGSLYRFNRKEDKFELFDPAISNLQSLAEDRDGNLWGGNYTSLYKIDPLAKQHRSWPIGYTVRCIHEDSNDRFWIGTDGGGLMLFNRKDGSFQRFTTSDGLPNNTILRMLEDKEHNLWLSTYNGICKFNYTNGKYRNFSKSDGLQSNQFSFNAGLALRSGEFLFGGILGFNIFYPDSIYDRKEMPPVLLTGVKIANIPAEDDSSYVTRRDAEHIKGLTLPYDKASLSLDFIALEYSGADKIQFAYILDGWDKNWNYVNSTRTANYSRLGEGDYVFRVKIRNPDGLWSEEMSLLTVVVRPPLYRSWWAYIFYTVSFAGLVFLYLRYSKWQERLKYDVKLARIEKEKEKEITEKKISFFTHIAHEFRTPLTLIISPLKDLLTGKNTTDNTKELSSVYRNARRLLSLTDQLLLFRKVESIDQQMRIDHFDIAEVCREVCMSFQQHAVSKHIHLQFEAGDQAIPIYADKEKIEIILFNLLSNSFKYTEGGGRISIALAEAEDNVTIAVKDTGTGISGRTAEKLFESFSQADFTDKNTKPGFGIGLYVSQKLALAHKGELSFTSIPAKGTEFQLILLKGRAHFNALYINEDYNDRATILGELIEEPVMDADTEPAVAQTGKETVVIDRLRSRLPSMVIVDDNADIRNYLARIFTGAFNIYEADDGTGGYELVSKHGADIVISDVMMKNMGGIELCNKIKANPALAHIPVVLLTASASDEARLKGIEGGAEDYLTKPFDKDIVVARIRNIMQGRNRLKDYFFNAVTLRPNVSIVGEHQEFIEKCIAVVEKHLDDPDFTIQAFCREIGMSHPSLYKKVKAISGLTINVFIRYLRLRKAAELLITTDKTIVEITYLTGFNDIRYFREQFFKLFEINPSEYIKRYRKVMGTKSIE